MSEYLPRITSPFQKNIPKRDEKSPKKDLIPKPNKSKYSHKRFASLVESNFNYETIFTTPVVTVKHNKKCSVADLDRRSLLNDSFYQDLMNKYCHKSPSKKTPKKIHIKNSQILSLPNPNKQAAIAMKTSKATQQPMFLKKTSKDDSREQTQFEEIMNEYFMTELAQPLNKPNNSRGECTPQASKSVFQNANTLQKQKDFKFSMKKKEDCIRQDAKENTNPSVDLKDKRKTEKKARFNVAGISNIGSKLVESSEKNDKVRKL